MFGFCRVLLIDITLDIHTATCHPFQQSRCIFYVWLHTYAVLMYARTYIRDFSIPLTRSARVSTLGQLFRQQPLDSPLSERSGAHATAVRKGGCWKVNLRRRYKNRITVFVQSFDFVILKTSKLREELELFVSSCSAL